MMDPVSTEASLTELLQKMQSGDRSAANEVFVNAANRLRGMSRSLMALEGCRSGSFEASDLVQEAYAQKVSRLDKVQPVRDREHFFSLMARGMRQVLVDRGRIRRAFKRSPRESGSAKANGSAQSDLSVALMRFAKLDPKAYRVLRLKTDHGLTWEEIAKETGLTVFKARSEYDHAIVWLRKQIS